MTRPQKTPIPHDGLPGLGMPSYFADCEAGFDEARYVVFGAPYDRTASFRPGAALGPEAIREAAWNFELWNPRLGIDLEEVPMHDMGNAPISNQDTPDEMVKKLEAFIQPAVRQGKVPIMLGGEHNLAAPVVRALKGAGKDFAVIHFDAHLDFRNEYEGEKNNHACVLRRISEEIGVEKCASVGVRSIEKQEWKEAQDQGLFYLMNEDVHEMGIQKAMRQLTKHVDADFYYLTLDIDGVDPAYAPGTGTPEPFGLTDRDARDVVRALAPNLLGLDVLEVAPPWDHGQTALLAAKLAREAIFYREYALRKPSR
jgi:agmatinase